MPIQNTTRAALADYAAMGNAYEVAIGFMAVLLDQEYRLRPLYFA